MISIDKVIGDIGISHGFRTLGRAVKPWAKQNDAKFFLDQEEALSYLRKISTPKL